jgi:nitroreductase
MTLAAATPTEAWGILPDGYPTDGYASDRLHYALRFAVLAPSGHNTQPWQFRVTHDDAVDVFADRSRALPVVDPHDRELVMSCGAALFGLRLALDAFGEQHSVQYTPEPMDFDLLARVQLTGRGAPDPEARRLLEAVTRRHTNRTAFERRPVPADVVRRMQDAATVEGARLHVVPDEARAGVADLIAAADRTQMENHSFRRELAQWLHTGRSHSHDGMHDYPIGLSDVMAAAEPLIVRTFDVGSSRAATDRELVEGSPLLAVLATDGDDVADWISAGQAMFRTLLVATDADLAASFLGQPVEVPDARWQLAGVAGVDGVPQLVLRFGYAPPVAPSPRRPLEEVLLPPR